MSNKVLRLYGNDEEISGRCFVAVVAVEEQGQALSLMLAHGEIREVFAHLSEVPVLKSGDRVLVQKTEEGLVVTGRLRVKGEGPRPLARDHSGRFILEAPAGLCLRAGEASIELTPDGRIQVDGKDIHGIAAGRFCLKGATVEIN
ncbi:hypothetical protein [Geoalkalibacter sp.]|uniref:hypothetical protein n=1 Tax=Geoalkalibacter sp. TaxID=3041440 RepID=UPI00272E7C0E|nr:hypothetical protein [Geoalkalibacter sp.]